MTAFMAGIPALKDFTAISSGAWTTRCAFQSNLAATRTGRASVHMLDQVKVDYYGTLTPINQMAQVSARAAAHHHLARDPAYLKKSKRPSRPPISASSQSDGKLIRIPVPPMTRSAAATSAST